MSGTGFLSEPPRPLVQDPAVLATVAMLREYGISADPVEGGLAARIVAAVDARRGRVG